MKKCGLCEELKPNNDFNKKRSALDGLQTFCRDCMKKRHRKWYKEMSDEQRKDVKRRAKIADNKRYLKSRIAGNRRVSDDKNSAKLASRKLPSIDGVNCHHWSYKKEHRLDVIPLSDWFHPIVHSYMIYDEAEKMYRRKDNNKLLDSKIAHLRFITNHILKEYKKTA